MGRYSHININKLLSRRKELRSKYGVGAFMLGNNVARASKLKGKFKGKPLIMMGNAYSLNYLNHDMLAHFMTFGCNRCLDPKFHFKKHPDFFTVVDRAPYIQQYKNICKYKGIRVLSETLFDPAVSCRRTKVQKPPPYQWYRYRAVASSNPNKPIVEKLYTFFSNDARVTSKIIPVVQTDLDDFLPSGANIAYCMLQIAITMGFNPIGICGVDMQWESKSKSHAIADGCGKKLGAFGFNSKRVMSFFRAAAHWAKKNEIAIYNLSPKGILSPTFKRMSEKEFFQKFGKYAKGKSVCPRKLLEFKPDKHICLSGTGMHHRCKSDLKDDMRGLLNSNKPRCTSLGKRSHVAMQERISSLSRARRAKRKEGHKK